MRRILEEFAYGNINPNEQSFNKNAVFGEAMRVLAKNEDKLLSQLDSENKLIFKKYIDAHGEVNRLTAMGNFIYGYKLGLLMTAEAFLTDDDLFFLEK